MKSADPELRLLLINQTWFASEFRAFGASAFSVGWNDNRFDYSFGMPALPLEELLEAIRPQFSPTHLIYFDDSGPISVLGLERSTLPLVFYSVDTHHHWPWHRCFARASDLVLAAQMHYLHVLRDSRPRWFPLWSDPLPTEAERTIGACFRGTLSPDLHPLRAQFIEEVSRRVPIDAAGGPWREVYTRAKIVLNQAVKDDLNFRVFEALSAGALLVTPDHTKGVTELFEPGKDLVLYENGNAEDAAAKIKYFLEHDDERRAIAASGAEKVHRLHSTEARAKELFELLRGLNRGPGEQRDLYVALAYLMCARVCLDSIPESAVRLIAAAVELIAKIDKLTFEVMSDFENAAVGAKYLLSLIGGEETAWSFVAHLAHKHPESVILQLADIERLLSLGQHGAALERASAISSSPEELIRSIPVLMATIQDELSLPGRTPS